MLRRIYRNRLQLLVLTLIMSAFLTFTASFAFGKVKVPDEATSFLADSSKYSIDYTLTPTEIICLSSALIKADKAGYLCLGSTMGLYIPRYAYSTDIVLTAYFSYNWLDDTIEFEFGPSPTSFNIPLELFMSWYDLDKFGMLDNPTLYYDGFPVACSEGDWGITYYLDHFSIYYFARR